MMLDQVILAGSVMGAIGVLILAGVKIAGFFRKVGHFLDDWFGEPARNGVVARAGVMDRLGMVERRTEQLVRNGGGSLRDAVDRTEEAVKQIATRGES